MRPEVTTGNDLPARRTVLGLLAGGLAATALPMPALAQAAPTRTMKADDAHSAAVAGKIILIDIRRPEEWLQTGVGEGAIGLDMTADGFVEALVSLRQANPDTPLAVICRTGNRSGYVVDALAQQGFPGLVDVAEGMAGGPRGQGWIPRGLPVYAGTENAVATQRARVMPE